MLANGTLLSSRYEIESVLGKGGMGAVYLARAKALGDKKVAVKELELRGFAVEELPKAVEQFKREASFLAHLEHPNLVSVSDFFSCEDKHYLVMSYVEGEDLQRRLMSRGAPFGWSEVEPWLRSLIDVLGYLHDHDPPILFRDLKPSNIMLSNTGRLHLIDFGIARTGQVGEKTCTFLRGTGTRGFSPIEQFGLEESCDQRSDIYSLGATLYYLLTGKRPPDAIERVALKREIKPASLYNSTIPKRLDAILNKAMAVSASDRYQSVHEIRRALKEQSRPLSPAPSIVSFTPVEDKEGPTEDLSRGRNAIPLQRSIAVACLSVLVLGLSSAQQIPDTVTERAVPQAVLSRVAQSEQVPPTKESMESSKAAGLLAHSGTASGNRAIPERRTEEQQPKTLPFNFEPLEEEPAEADFASSASVSTAPTKKSTPVLDLGSYYPKATVLISTPKPSEPAPTSSDESPSEQAIVPAVSTPMQPIVQPETKAQTTVSQPAESRSPSTVAEPVYPDVYASHSAPSSPPGYRGPTGGQAVAMGSPPDDRGSHSGLRGGVSGGVGGGGIFGGAVSRQRP